MSTNSVAPVAQLAAALAKAQAEMGGATKSKKNPHFKSSYADLSEVWDAARPALVKHGLSVVQMPSADGSRVTVTTLLLHESGEQLASALTMTAAQDTPQAIGSCITYARRYALAAMVGVTPEDDDGNAASASAPAPARAATPARAPNGFEAWWQTFGQTARTGYDALATAWREAPVEFRAYAQQAHAESLADLKAAAKEVA